MGFHWRPLCIATPIMYIRDSICAEADTPDYDMGASIMRPPKDYDPPQPNTESAKGSP